MSRRFQFSLIWFVIGLLAIMGTVISWLERAANQKRLAEQSQQLDNLSERVDAMANESKKSESELRDLIRRMGQRPPRGKIEETYDKFDVPNGTIERD
jgi:predicted negative regulator of RcsB-dependent stress response